MLIHVLGSAAGGGFPQWNCNCRNCSGVRSGALRARPRTQSSIAASMDGERWILFNTSPDIRAQLEACPPLRAHRNTRGSGITAIVYLDSHIDHTTGLLMLREGCPHPVYCTDCVYEDLTSGFPLFTLLAAWNGGVERHRIDLQEPFQIPGVEGLRLTPVPLAGKPPPYSPHRNNPRRGDNIGLLLEDLHCGKSVFYAPGLGGVDAHLLEVMGAADCLLVDGTFWREDEMAAAGVGTKPASAMGHLPQTGPGGMLEILEGLAKPRKILIHINNTNPILDENSAERNELQRRGVEVAYDGLAIEYV